MNVEEIYQFLIRNGITESVATLLRNQGLDEDILQDTTENDIASLNITLADRKKVMRVLRMLKPSTSSCAIEENIIIYDPEAENSIQEEQLESSTQVHEKGIRTVYPKDRNLTVLVEQMTKKGADYKNLYNKLIASQFLEEIDQRRLTEIIGRDMVTKCGNYPTTTDKNNMGHALLKSFPYLAKKHLHPRTPAYNLWFDDHGSANGKKPAGRLQQWLENNARRLRQEEKKYTPRQSKIRKLTDSQNVAGEEYEDFEKRRALIQASKSVADIVDIYPNILGTNGEMIDNDFARLSDHDGKIENIKNYVFDVIFTSDDETLQFICGALVAFAYKRNSPTSAITIFKRNEILKPLVIFVDHEDFKEEAVNPKHPKYPMILSSKTDDMRA
uniref:SAM domain-containing protein n=1 Tax=Lutzomyia longipalpis TaxID=7200 RepID=A0A1B0CSQ3_LUTLO